MLPVPSVVEVDGLDRDLRVKGVLVEQDSTTNVMGNEEMAQEALLLEVLDRFLKSVPFPRNVFSNDTVSASSEVLDSSSRC